MLVLHDISFAYPGRDTLFSGLHLSIERGTTSALIGDNGSGKSSLLRIMAGASTPTAGTLTRTASTWYVPQWAQVGADGTVAGSLGIAPQLDALRRILDGRMTGNDLALLDDDWTLEERCLAALATWGLASIGLDTPIAQLSGGERTKVMLAGIDLHLPELLLLDEPSNHLDRAGRQLLYQRIEAHQGATVVVSHDRALLERCSRVYLLERGGLQVYGGNFSFYAEQRAAEQQALAAEVQAQEKALRHARQVARDTVERQQKLDARGKRKQEKSGVPTIMLNTLRDQAQHSTAKLQGLHADKVADAARALREGREALGSDAWMRFGFGTSTLHRGKVLVEAMGINVAPSGRPLWSAPLDLRIHSGERIAVQGCNGSGKTTLLRLVMGTEEPSVGTIHRAIQRAVYVDQHYSLLNDDATVLQQAEEAAATGTAAHVIKTRLDHFLFPAARWDAPVAGLSGGERLRLTLCCLTLGETAPDLLVLDEPTNNLDLRNMTMLVQAVARYTGTLLVVSHDERFLADVGVERMIAL